MEPGERKSLLISLPGLTNLTAKVLQDMDYTMQQIFNLCSAKDQTDAIFGLGTAPKQRISDGSKVNGSGF